MEELKDEERKPEDELFECLNCGAKLKPEEEFCPKCGMKKGEQRKIICQKCGAELQLKQKFCPKCGAKTKVEMDDIVNSVKKDCRKTMKSIKIKRIHIMLFVIICIIAFVVIRFSAGFIKKMSVTVDDLLADGKYTEAYQKAKNEEKDDVILENTLAVLSNTISEGLKNPASFSLTSAWFDKDNKKIVMNVSGTNSYGGVVSSYYYCTYSDTDNKYEVYCSLSDLSNETYSKYDSSDEKMEKLIKNVARSVVKGIIYKDEYKVQGKMINNINKLFKEKKLNDIELIKTETV